MSINSKYKPFTEKTMFFDNAQIGPLTNPLEETSAAPLLLLSIFIDGFSVQQIFP